jgi:peptidoglycan/LPS O-acetylase OafA/YrhL
MHIHTLDLLRGIAALMVVIVHFAGTGFLGESWIAKVSGYGQHGVMIFFVISGFIIPYALSKKNYLRKDFQEFMIRRLARLNPPYYASLFLTIGFSYCVSIFSTGNLNNSLVVFDLWKIFLHLTYLIPFTSEAWYNNIYWTLAIEFQYYLLIGLFYPFIFINKYFTLVGLTLICFSHYLVRLLPSFLPSFLPCRFSIGAHHLS